MSGIYDLFFVKPYILLTCHEEYLNCLEGNQISF